MQPVKVNKADYLFLHVVFATMVAGYLVPAVPQVAVVLLLPLIWFYGIMDARNLRFSPILWPLLAATFWLMVVHGSDQRSVLNLMLSGTIVLALAVTARRIASQDLPAIPMLCHACEVLLWVTIGLSLIGTASHAYFGPEYFPWQALIGDERLRFLTTESYGHTASLWLSMFALLGRLSARRAEAWKLGNVSMIALLVIMVLLTKTRVALLMLLVAVAFTAFRMLRLRPRAFALLLVMLGWTYCALYFALQFNDEARVLLESILRWAQDEYPDVRLVAQGSSVIFSGRDYLNAQLVEIIHRAPWVGVGQSDPNLNWAYSSTPYFAFLEASSESPLRVPAKYGIPFGVLFLLIYVRATWACRKEPLKAALLACVIITSSSEATMESMQYLGGIFFFAMMIAIEQDRVESSAKRSAVAARLRREASSYAVPQY